PLRERVPSREAARRVRGETRRKAQAPHPARFACHPLPTQVGPARLAHHESEPGQARVPWERVTEFAARSPAHACSAPTAAATDIAPRWCPDIRRPGCT